jgi:1-acyl-sn-glycerol-3-phosphate acyltransferase/long-chain acyl-CoA synthetase
MQWEQGAAIDLAGSMPQDRRGCPRPPEALVQGVRSVAAMALRWWLRCYHRFEVIGQENLPADGSFVLVANHTSHLDAPCLLSVLPPDRLHHAYPAAAEDYFFATIPRAAVAILVNALPFFRHARVRQSIDLCRRLLRAPGNVLILFPEGTRSLDGTLQQFRPGVGTLLAGLDVPVVPCAISGAHRALPKGCVIPRPGKLRLTIGLPRRFEDADPGKDSARGIARELHDAVKELQCT